MSPMSIRPSPLPDPDFWRGRRVLLTGHTGFKGAWTALWLERMGAAVTGIALAPETEPNLFALAGPWQSLDSHIIDIRDAVRLAHRVAASDPQVVIHMAAQALVRRGHDEPRATFETNVQGTANLLDALQHCANLEAVLVVTSDKCYRNDNSGRPFTEADALGGADPYSASKAAQEMVVQGWQLDCPLVTARAGNVIGGGDWAADRVLPDLLRAVDAGAPVKLRNPHATRPWQHVLDVLAGYLVYLERLASAAPIEHGGIPPALNFGPPASGALRDARHVAWLVETAIAALRANGVDAADWQQDGSPGPVEASVLALDPALAQATLGWRTRLDAATAVAWTAEWHARLAGGGDARTLAFEQIDRFADTVADTRVA